MSKYTKIGTGNAFVNSNTEGNKPQYSGNKFELELDGKTHELQLAILNVEAKNGNKYLRVVLTKVEDDE